MTVLYADPICTSKHSPSFGVAAVNTGRSLQEPFAALILIRNCRGTALNGLTLSKLVVPAGKSSRIKATT